MGTLWIKDFRIGLDNRKGELALRPGTLVEAKNGYITQGGEFTNRKAFVPPSTTFPSGCFGLQSTSAGLLTFGSDTTPAGFPNFNIGTVSVPIYVNYVRLQHPAVLAGTTYDAAKHAMTNATLSENFGGYAWVVCTFADGHSYPYYNGTPVYDFIDGLVLPDRATTALIATDIIAMINRTGHYSATSPGASLVNIEGPKDTLYTLDITETSAGSLSQTHISDPVTSTAGVAATASLWVTGGSHSAGVNKITSVTINGVTITNAAVDWTTDNTATAALIAASINAKVSSPDYTADSTGARVDITAAVVGTTANGLEVVANCAGNFCVGDCLFAFSGTKSTVTSFNVNGVNILTDTSGTPVTVPFGPSTANLTLADWATAIGVIINQNTTAGTAHGYLCFVSGSSLIFSKAVTKSSDADITCYFILDNTTGGNGVVLASNPIAGTGFTVALSPDAVAKKRSQFAPVQTDEVTVYTPNSPAQYTYHWRLISETNSGKISVVSPNERITRFSLSPEFFSSTTTYVAIYVCDVTDLTGFTVTTNQVTVSSLKP